MKISFTLFFLLCFVIPVTLYSQQRTCGTHEFNHANPTLKTFYNSLNKNLNNDFIGGSLKTSEVETLIKIPVVVHIIHNEESEQIKGNNISDDQIFSQIQILNEDFRKIEGSNGDNSNPLSADTRIEFCLATRDPAGNFTSGINRVYNSRISYNYLTNDRSLKALSYWPSDQYLNIWVTRLSGDILGYAQFPEVNQLEGLSGSSADFTAETDGVVINYKAFGKNGTATAPFDLGRTATHEIGHWLGLIHTFGDDFEDDVCSDDYVADTPEQEQPSPDTDCTPLTSFCNAVPQPYTVENYMDYSADRCMNLFTIGQKERMRNVISLNKRRNDLLKSPGCCGDGSALKLPVTEDFESQADGWKIINPDNGAQWDYSSPGGFSESSTSISISESGIYSNSSGNTYYDILETPFIAFDNTTGPLLRFDLAYSYSTALQSDCLVVSYDLSCSENYLPLLILQNEELSTTGRVNANFVPVATEWKTIELRLTDLQNVYLAKFRFEFYSKGGNKLYIDNFNITETSPKFLVNIFPNPAKEGVFIDMIFDGEQDINYVMYNALGQKMTELRDEDVRSFTKFIETHHINPGIYFLEIKTNDQRELKRIMIAQ